MIKRFITSVWSALIGCIDRGEILPKEPSTFKDYIGKATSCKEMVILAYEWKALPDYLRIEEDELTCDEANAYGIDAHEGRIG